MTRRTRRKFSGRDMAMILVGGFAVVFAVNFTMAALATRGFGGVVVENSYVASQNFNGWLDAERAQEQLGWSVDIHRAKDGRLMIETVGAPQAADVSAHLRHPLGQKDEVDLTFQASGKDRYRSDQPMPAGRWIARVTIVSGSNRWVGEQHVE
ncbi:hypothetical protein F7D01_11970 [Erythrobacter sp. 3-20A1M]|uniref:FixH family protein n=1 Tax=Erythrobacter sp. 3-20A1M TaxID=2653850 RepID=UPI001BFC8EC1|nr:FixH family protein [Erythrobacter sp. 3-20A1M]QWC57697.1 hypothetical protein F7D01_11970 [Erythrobacter sp. 3-20A1M]